MFDDREMGDVRHKGEREDKGCIGGREDGGGHIPVAEDEFKDIPMIEVDRVPEGGEIPEPEPESQSIIIEGYHRGCAIL